MRDHSQGWGAHALISPEMAKYMLPTPGSFPGLLLDKAVAAFAGLGLEDSAESCLLRHLLFLSGHSPLFPHAQVLLQLSPADPGAWAFLEAEPGSQPRVCLPVASVMRFQASSLL